MSRRVIEIENLSKHYLLGEYGSGTLYEDLNTFWKQFFKKSQYDSFGRLFKALDGINFTVEEGEVIGVIGKNGAGKSTLLKILSRITAPTSGTVKINGKMASLLEVGTGFHPELTGRENIFLNGAIMGMTKAETAARMEQIIDFSGCRKHIDTPVKRYSSGMRVRLGFAVAAHLDVDILIVDEVLAVGDHEFQKKCLNKMREVSSSGRTVLFVSHNMDSIMRLCQRCICLENGTIKFQGPTSEVIDDYLGTFNDATDHSDHSYPETDHIAIQNVQISTQGNQSLGNQFNYCDALTVAIDYRLHNKAFNGGFALLLRNIRDEVVFSSWDTDPGPALRQFQDGDQVQITIPAELVRPGLYELAIVVHDRAGGLTQKHLDYRIKMTINDDGSINGLQRPGAVVPRLDWHYTSSSD